MYPEETKGFRVLLVSTFVLVVVTVLLLAYANDVSTKKEDIEKRLELEKAEVLELEREIDSLETDVQELEREKQILLDEVWGMSQELEKMQGAEE